MIENPRRQIFLVVLVAAFAMYFALGEKPSLGLDLSGGTQLIYELPIEEAKASGELDKEIPNEALMAETLGIIAERIDPTGTKEAGITPRGETGFMVELPDVTETEAEIIKRQIETLGRLEMRLLTTIDYDEDGVRFDLAKEKANLNAWLDEADNRADLATHPERIDRFNNISSPSKGRINQDHLRWYAHKIFPSYRDNARWDYAISSDDATYAVPVYDPSQYSAPPPPQTDPENKPYLVELIPINMHATNFQGEDMNAAGVRAGKDPDTGLPCVFYEVAAGRKSEYADWSGDNRGNQSAIILNGIVRSAPRFIGRIYGSGLITGSFTTQEAADLAKVIKTGSLQIKPEFISGQTIGAQLGQRSITLGLISIGVGGLLVLLFILAYYRTAGLVAFVAIALNIFLIYGIVQFIRATITLPGIAGLVLTMGMAVDANILIYERIREEIKKGKELLQAVRAGFDRAMVTILDANVTTFLAGIVLYNVGVGPVRGFAVTLMVGILTSLFAALVVTRLAFHLLLTSKKLTEFSAASWFTNISMDFVSVGRRAFIGSMIAIVLGIGYVSTVSADHMLGLDFTGGASMELHLGKASTEHDVRQRLADDKAFNDSYPDAQVIALGSTNESFSVKLKLTEAQRAELQKARDKAKSEGKAFEPPFREQLLHVSGMEFVQNAFSEVSNNPLPGGDGASNMGQARINFASPVKIAEVESRLTERYGEVFVTPKDTEAASSIFVEFPVWKDATDADITDAVALTLEGMKDAAGNDFALSNPIPSAEVIGNKMVGELRTAAIGAMVLSLFLIVMYIRIRFREYKYGFAAVAALVHDVLITLSVVVIANSLGLANAEIDLPMIAAFLTIIGYSINDTIVIFDRVRENVSENKRLGDTKETFGQLINRSVNQTLSRTILTSGTTLFVVLAVFLVNRGTGSGLEGFALALIVGIVSGTYSTIFIASPLVLWLRDREDESTEKGANLVTEKAASV